MAAVKLLRCASVWRVSRSGRDDCITYEQARENHADAQIVINTTPCGMYPHVGVSAVNLDDYPKVEGVVDVVYNPLSTALICDARQRGIPAVGGLYMLVAQAATAAEKFTGQIVTKERVDTIYRHMVTSKENIVLIGMPGSGKTTVGKRVAAMLQRPFVDTDVLIEEKTRRSIPDLFRQMGESGFRDLETEVIRSIASMQGAVIATGGGAVLRKENVHYLRENGRLYFLDRPLSMLSATADRPLSSTTSDLQQRYEERYPIYATVCDRHLDADGEIEDVVNLIREDVLS